jgi:hypothetical protein
MSTSTSNNEAPVQEDKVCWHYPKAECAHDGDYKCWYCVDFDLDAICFHYLSGECANNDECAHLHPAELDPALIPLLATPPHPCLRILPQTAGLGRCITKIWHVIMNEVTYQYEGGGWLTLPAPHSFSYNLRPPPASRTAAGQPSNTCAYNLEHCWAPHSADPIASLEQPATVEEPHVASANTAMLDRLIKAMLGYEPMEREDGSAEVGHSNISNGREKDPDVPERQRGSEHDR